MKRIGAVCEELFMASSARVEERKKSGCSEPSKQTKAGTQTSCGKTSRSSVTSGGEASATTSMVARTGSIPRSSHQSSGGSSSRTGLTSRGTQIKTSSVDRIPDRSEGLTTKGFEQRILSAPVPRSHSRPSTSRHSSVKPDKRSVSGKYRAQSLSIDPSICNGSTASDELSPREVQGLDRKSVPVSTDGGASSVRRVESSDSDEIVFSKATSVENLTRQETRNRSSAPTLKAMEKRNENSSYRTADGPPFLRELNLPRLPETSVLDASPKRRAKSERVEPFHSSLRNSSRTVSQSLHLGRAASLRAEGVSILPILFSRGRLLSWPLGVAPQVVYAAETSHELDDGHGASGLSPTLLCKMGAKHRAWDVVRFGERFCVRVVGWHGGALRDVPGGKGGRAVVYSVLHKDAQGRSCVVEGGPAHVHDECTSSYFNGYHYVSERRGAAISCMPSDMEQIGLTVGLWAGGGTGESRGADLCGEVRWRLLREGETVTKGRNGRALLRFGYYFFLDVPCATRLFTNTDTPEHVRLVARRAGDGAIDEEASKQLTYVVVRVAAD